MNVKYLILGAGPSGLSFAHALRRQGEESFLVLEQEPTAGGLCRSTNVDGAPLDIGGGHFLDDKKEKVLDFLFSFLARDEWQPYNRISKILLGNLAIDYPLEANLWQLPLPEQLDYLESIAQAGSSSGSPPPQSFAEWIGWKLGHKIAEEYMLPYNRKIWSIALNQFGTYWLYKLPNVSFRETLQSCLERKPQGSLPAHGRFLYPKNYGYGEVWRRMGTALGEKLCLNTPVTRIELPSRRVNGEILAEKIITTIPWSQWLNFAEPPPPIRASLASLKYASIDIDYYPVNQETTAHWLYVPAETIPYHRILCRHLFCLGSRGYWTETNSERAQPANGWRKRNEFAYPLNTLDKPAAVQKILAWAEKHAIFGLGRWGTWEHMNSDVAVENALNLATKLRGQGQ